MLTLLGADSVQLTLCTTRVFLILIWILKVICRQPPVQVHCRVTSSLMGCHKGSTANCSMHVAHPKDMTEPT